MTRFPLPVLVLAALSAGCGRKPPAPDPEEVARKAQEKADRARKEAQERLNVATTAGGADRRDPEKGVRLYRLDWKSAALTLGRSGIQEGKMNGVSGTVFESEKPKSTFTATTGYAKKETQTLYLEGRVEVKSPRYRATLRARKLEWLPDVKRYRATGDVTITTPDGISGPMPELLATSDLRRFGTPDMFDRR